MKILLVQNSNDNCAYDLVIDERGIHVCATLSYGTVWRILGEMPADDEREIEIEIKRKETSDGKS